MTSNNLALFLIVPLAACATPAKTFIYPKARMTIHEASPKTVHNKCEPDAVCCVSERANGWTDIWVSWDHVECLTHELCHWLLGLFDPDCDPWDWNDTHYESPKFLHVESHP